MAMSGRRRGGPRRPVKDREDGEAQAQPNVRIRISALQRLFSLLRPYSGRLVIAALLLLVTSGLGLIFPLVIGRFLNTILTNQSTSFLDAVAAALFAVFILQAVLSSIQGYILTSVGERLSVDLRVQLFGRLQSLPMSFFDQRRTGELISRVTNDVTVLEGSLTSNVIPIVSQIVTLVGSVTIAAFLNWRLTLVVLLVTPPAGLIAALLGRRIRNTTRGVQEGLGEAGIVLEEALSAPRVVKAFARENYEMNRFSVRMRESLRQALRRAMAQSSLGPLIGLIGFSAIVIVLWYGGHEVIAHRLTIGDFVAYMFYLIAVVGPLIAITGIYSQLQTALAAADRVFGLIDEPTEKASADTSLPDLPPIKGHISYYHVAFTYAYQPPTETSGTTLIPMQRTVLHDMSFEALSGQVVALVGPSGAGKTTTLNLLLRLYEIDSGVIRIDDTDIRTVNARSLREQMAIVPQEPVLFGGTIAENIRYGRLDASDDEVHAAAAAANALTFIEALPDGFGSLVGERGTKLSAGQRQRIAIARALLRNPRILLLDEATASLDNESEALVQDALNRLMQGRTTVVVAHRLTTVERADLILVLNGGSIAERGTHTELMALGGLYYRLYTRNFVDIESEQTIVEAVPPLVTPAL